jgi:hypothetical protein
MPIIDYDDNDRDVVLEKFDRKNKTACFKLQAKPHHNVLANLDLCLTFKEMYDLKVILNYLLKGVKKEDLIEHPMEKLWKKKQTIGDFPKSNYHPVINTCFFCGNEYDCYQGKKCLCQN